MQLRFSCPECTSPASLELNDEEVKRIKTMIVEEGRSPTLLSRCSKGHELLVTLYFRDDEFGVRDVAVPMEPNQSAEPEKKQSELDWVRSTFGGSKK
jgi:hypothetical protein